VSHLVFCGQELAIATRAPVREALSLLIKVVFPAIAAGLVIGKGGDVLKHLRSTTGASLQLLARDSHPFLAVERFITIVGSLDHVTLAAHAIFELLQAEPERSAYTHASVSYLPTAPTGSQRPPIAGSPWSGQHYGFSPAYVSALSTPTQTPQITPDKVSTGFFSQASPVLAQFSSDVATSVVTATSSAPRVFAEPGPATLAPMAYPDKSGGTAGRLTPIDTTYAYPTYGTATRGYTYPGTPTYAQSPTYAYGPAYTGSYGYPHRDPRTSYRYGWVPSPTTAVAAPAPVCPNKLCQYGCACTSDTLLVPDGLVGVVFGKGGSSLLWLQQSTHTKISLASRHHADTDNPMRWVRVRLRCLWRSPSFGVACRTLTFIGPSEGIAHAKLVISGKIADAQRYGRGAPAATPTSATSVDTDVKSALTS
jgi:hypothetical protein